MTTRTGGFGRADSSPGSRPIVGAVLAYPGQRSADLLREDADYLETLAVRARADLPHAEGHPGVDLDALAALPRAVRTRVWRLLAAEAGAPLADVSAAHVESLDALLTSWHGQGPLHVPGGIAVARDRGTIRFTPLRNPANA